MVLPWPPAPPALIRIQAPEDLGALFAAGPGEAFFAAARPRAAAGDAEAQFLLGKAYHLGRGVAEDLGEAEAWYGKAAAQGHARALHNLGVLRLDVHRDRPGAIALLKQALAQGLTVPTRHTLGRAHDRAPLTVLDSAEDLATAADWYAQAFEETQDPESLDAAVAAAVKAVVLSRDRETPDQTAERTARAQRLGEQGAALGRARSLQNLGALHYYAGDYPGALPWVRRAAALDQPTALYTLGEMHRLGQALPKDADAAFPWYDRASRLGHGEATQEVLRHWTARAEHTDALPRLREAVAALTELQGRPAAAELFVGYPLEQARTRLAFLEAVQRAAEDRTPVPPGLPRVRIQLLDIPAAQGGVPLSHTDWWMGSCWLAGDSLERSGILVKGRADARGWIRLTRAQVQRLRAELARGRTLLFHWPGQARTLTPRPLAQGGWALVPELDAPY